MYECETNVANCPIFRDMSEDEREAVFQLCEIREFRRGVSVLIEGNDHPHGVWTIRSGHCEVVHQSPEVGEKQVNFLHSGAIFGEISFFDPRPHSATVRVVEPAELLFFPTEALTKLQENQPRAAQQFILNMGRIMAQKLRRIDARLLAEMVVTASLPSSR